MWRTSVLTRRYFLAGALALGTSGCTQFIGDNRDQVPLSWEALAQLAAIGSTASEAMLVRIFKQSSELEVWKRTQTKTYKLFRTYKICAWSGVLGPKIKEGDRQAPEGFYSVKPWMMNPKSALYLSFNTGFPNRFDQALGRTGTNLMVHGACSSAGCYSMTDAQIKEIYALARDSFRAGNKSFQLQMFPFRMTTDNLVKYTADPNYAFWSDLKVGADIFEKTLRPPMWDVCNGRYEFAEGTSDDIIDATLACAEVPSMAGTTA